MNNFEKLKEKMNEKNVDLFIIIKRNNQQYLTNFSGSTSITLVTNKSIILYTDGRYKTQANQEKYEYVDVKVLTQGESLISKAIEVINGSDSIKNIGIETEEINYMTYLEISNSISSEKKIIPLFEEVDKIRRIKNSYEIEQTKKAIEITDKTYSYIRETIKPGMTEKQVANLIDFKQKDLGASGNSFSTIVASGINSSKPHAIPTDKVINDGDIVTIDFGCVYNRYTSDMTRTFFVGKPSDERLVKIYNIVRETQLIQINLLKDGVSSKMVDSAGREYMKKFDMDQYFSHGTGHSMGLNVHENPRLNQVSDTILKAGMIVTIEPGIYIEGLGGVRIENDILIKENGHEILNSSIIDKY